MKRAHHCRTCTCPPTDADVLTSYVHARFRRTGGIRGECWPTIRQAAKGLRWSQARVEQAIEDAEHLDTQAYYCHPPQPRHEHEIYSTADSLDSLAV